jgi:hypothetical protein
VLRCLFVRSSAFLIKAKISDSIEDVFRAKKISREEIKSGDSFNILPLTKQGKLSLIILFAGLILFFTGVLMGSQDLQYSSHAAVIGMIIFFMGGWLRTRFS